jgi:hypothetical protein
VKEPQYIEGKQAVENFEEGMKALFKVPKERVVKGRLLGAPGSRPGFAR